MKGLDWIAVASNIAFDGDLEYHSDAAFRTYIEMLGLTAFLLGDGHLEARTVRVRCNSRYLRSALRELSDAGYIVIDGDDIFLPKYQKWQKMRAEVEAERAKTASRMRRFRGSSDGSSDGVTNGVTNGVGNATRVEKSRVEKESKSAREETDPLTQLALEEIDPSDSTPEDYRRTIDRYRGKLPDHQIERVILALANWKPDKPRPKLHLTLANWLSREKPERASPDNGSGPQYEDIVIPEGEW